LTRNDAVVIFTTAHDEHAIRAFEVSAVDYLLKPFKQPRFRKALDRARTQLQAAKSSATMPQLNTLISQWREMADSGPRVLVKSPDRILFLKPEEIDHIEACGNYGAARGREDRARDDDRHGGAVGQFRFHAHQSLGDPEPESHQGTATARGRRICRDP
jgi:hypothetical protein